MVSYSDSATDTATANREGYTLNFLIIIRVPYLWDTPLKYQYLKQH